MFCKSPFRRRRQSQRQSVLVLRGNIWFAMQGPYSEELNLAMLKHINAAYFVTKESGGAGGFEEKKKAAQKAGGGTYRDRAPERRRKKPSRGEKTYGRIPCKGNLLWYTTNVAKKHACGYLRRCLSRRIRTVSEENKTCGSKKPIWRKETWALFQWNSF